MKSNLLSYLIIAACAMAFSSKGIIAKYAYPYGVSPLQILGLRMGLAIPVYIVIALVLHRRHGAMPWAMHGRLIGLGFLGYYLAAVLDFHGLALMSAGLERMLLQSYPIIVVVLSLVFLKMRFERGVWYALAATSAGILLSFAGEVTLEGANPSLGAGLVLSSATCFAVYVLLAKPVIGAIGPVRFITTTMLYSAMFLLTHVAYSEDLGFVLTQPTIVYRCAVLLAVFGTLIPSFLMAWGMKRVEPHRFAIITTTGPVSTLAIAWFALGETPSGMQAVGMGLTIVSCMAMGVFQGRSGGREKVN